MSFPLWNCSLCIGFFPSIFWCFSHKWNSWPQQMDSWGLQVEDVQQSCLFIYLHCLVVWCALLLVWHHFWWLGLRLEGRCQRLTFSSHASGSRAFFSVVYLKWVCQGPTMVRIHILLIWPQGLSSWACPWRGFRGLDNGSQVAIVHIWNLTEWKYNQIEEWPGPGVFGFELCSMGSML